MVHAITAALGATTAGLGAAAIASDGSSDQMSSISLFSDVKPTNWAYQALANLIERYGCVADEANSRFQGEHPLTRFEAAALLNACLEHITEVTDEIKKLMAEFEQERAVFKGRVDGLGTKVGVLEAQQFSTTTKLSGQATMVLGSNAFFGSAIDRNAGVVNTVNQGPLALPDAFTFNYDLQLILDTSFNGSDLLRMILRSGNFDSGNNSFGGGGPTSLSQLEVAFQEESGANIVGIDKLYYQAPLGSGFTATVGGRVGQEDMLAFWPSVYPTATVLDVMTMAGAPVAYNLNLGTGAGLWWQNDAWSISTSYVAAAGGNGSYNTGGIGSTYSGSTFSVQVGYKQPQWGIAALYAAVQNDTDIVPYGTNFMRAALDAYDNQGMTHAFALSGYWQPSSSGWIPSISAGWGLNSTNGNGPLAAGSLLTSQSWSVGLNWNDAFVKGNAAGMAFGQAPFATSLSGGTTPVDGNWMWEWWYSFQITDAISITPALFYLSRPLGQETPGGQSFNQLGALIKTQFRF